MIMLLPLHGAGEYDILDDESGNGVGAGQNSTSPQFGAGTCAGGGHVGIGEC